MIIKRINSVTEKPDVDIPKRLPSSEPLIAPSESLPTPFNKAKHTVVGGNYIKYKFLNLNI
jgi:hypothetical protein